jgi:phage gpG-like protein
MSEVTGFNAAIGRVARMRDRAANPQPALTDAAKVFGESVRENFEVGGRPPWKPHALATRKRTYGPSRLLIQSGDFENSFTPFVTRTTAGQRSGLIYGPRQNFGYKGGPGRGHSPTPARPVAVYQYEDEREISRVFLDHVTR